MSENVMVRAVYKCPLCGRLLSTGPAQEVPRGPSQDCAER